MHFLDAQQLRAHLLQKIDDAGLYHAELFVGGVGRSEYLEDPRIESSAGFRVIGPT
jgi:hypothetical protein